MVTCERCGTESPVGYRFCGACGAALAPDDRSGGTRKVITAVFCDVVGSTELGERLDPEVLRNVLGCYFESISATIERHGGTVQKFAGDAVMAVFGIPQVREDDALRAVRAAAEIRRTLPEVAEEVGVTLRFRTGINTGLVLTDEGRSLALGDAVNLAARLEQAAGPDEIIIGPETLRHVRDAVEVQPLEPLWLKGKSEPLSPFRLLRVDPTAPGIARRFDAGLVGRGGELGQLRGARDLSAGGASCQLLTVIGGAGVGKSRLVAELLAEADEATILAGRCLPYGEGITFWPLIEALAEVGEQARTIREHLAAGGLATHEELFLEVRLLLESLAAERPVILCVDDLQWAEPMLLELLEHVAAISRGAPILVLCTARDELLERRPDWGARGANVSRLRLEPLAASECEQLLDDLGGDLGPEARARVIETSEGNPLFLQEMVAFARERGTDAVPPTIQALLGARLEQLSGPEREPLERGSVEGLVFHQAAVGALGGGDAAGEIAERLRNLVGKDLIRPHPGTLIGSEAFRFRHLLIRDATYERLPMATRADLHERFASWLERVAGGLLELDEIAGWHLEQAVGYQRALQARADPELARRAAEHLLAAGRRAGERSDIAAAEKLLSRGLGLAAEGSPLRARIAVGLAEWLIELGELGRADELLTVAAADRDAELPASLGRLEWLVLARPEEAANAIRSELAELLDRLARAGDERGMARAHMLAFWRHWTANDATRAAIEAHLAAEHARSAGDSGLRARALGWHVATLMYGGEGPQGISNELDRIEAEGPGPYLAACIDLGRAEVQRLRGSFEHAVQLTDRALEGFRGLGMQIMAAGAQQLRASIELSRGEASAARALLADCDRILADLGERSQRSTTQALNARACVLCGDLHGAGEALELAEGLAAAEEVTVFAVTHGVRAGLALAAGDNGEAHRWALSAVNHASQTDFVVFQAQARAGLAGVLAALGDKEAARDEASIALELFSAKGDRPGSEAARSLLATLGGG